MTKKIFVLLFFLFIVSLILRVIYLPRLAVSFHYDMARDAYTVSEILSGDLKILGPPASTAGLFHGVFYYYLLAPAYFMGRGSPVFASFWLAFLNSWGVFLIYYLTSLITKHKGTSLLAATLYAVSFGVSQYAAWLSNPSIAIWTVPLIYLGLWIWICRQKKWGAALTGLGLGLSMQAEIFLGYHLLPILFWLVISWKKIKVSEILQAAGVFLLTISSMLLAEVKFGFKGIAGIRSLFFGEDVFVQFRSLGDFIVLYLNQIGRLFSLTLFPSNIGYGGFFGVILLIYAFLGLRAKKDKNPVSWQLFLLSYILSHFAVVSLGGIGTPFVTAGLEMGILILTSVFLWELSKKNKKLAIFLVVIIVLSNVATILKENKKGQGTFVIQKEMILARQLEALDYTYNQARGEPFSVNTLTNPLWINTTWSYLYNWYGLKKYGYLPEWRGRDQIGQLGDNLPKTSGGTKLHFFIIEPMQGIPEMYLGLELGAEDSRSQLLEEQSFAGIRVQKRLVTN